LLYIYSTFIKIPLYPLLEKVEQNVEQNLVSSCEQNVEQNIVQTGVQLLALNKAGFTR